MEALNRVDGWSLTDHLLQLPSRQEIIVAAPRTSAPVPFESLQHPLSVYQALLEVAA